MLFPTLLAFLIPLAVYCWVLAAINRRGKPTMVGGTWDCAGMLLSAGGILLMVGPVVAPDAGSAMAVIDDLSAGHDGRARVDVPIDQTEFMTLLGAAGFNVGDEAPVMIYNGEALPGDRSRLFAIATRAFC